MPGSTMDQVWRAQDTTPGAIETALREMLGEVHQANAAYVPARVLNLVCVVDREYSGEIANRLRRVGRFHASRTVVCSVESRRTTLDAVATIAAPADTRPGESVGARETIIVDCGPKHLAHLDRIVDPLVVPDLPTVVWSPHGHPEAVDALHDMAQVVLLDSVDEPELREAIERPRQLGDGGTYVVDLAWLRSAPWRERIAGTFDPPQVRPALKMISELTVRHHPDSAVAALLLCGWLASRLGWKPQPLVHRSDGSLSGSVHAHRQDVTVRLESDPTMGVRGLAGITVATAGGMEIHLDRGPGGLHARGRRGPKSPEREWTVLGASRGEGGILGEGIRQALLRDSTYRPALAAAAGLLP